MLDGPIDPVWVENLNSVLDDNKKLSLPNGESVKLNDTISIVMESNSLFNVTPATISRCGLMYLPLDVSTAASHPADRASEGGVQPVPEGATGSAEGVRVRDR